MIRYASVEQLLGAAPAHLLAQLTGSQELDPVKAGRALDDASAEIDGYLGGRYTLPLEAVPSILVGKCCDIAIYKLMPLRSLGALEDARQRYEDAVRFLERVADGKVGLGIPTSGPGSETATTGGVSFVAPPRIMDKSGYWSS